MSNQPVIIYLAKDGCPACVKTDPEWKKVVSQLGNKFNMIEFTCYRMGESLPPPPCLEKYTQWFPTILMAGPNSYYRCFTVDDKINTVDYSPDYIIKAIPMNAVETASGYEYTGHPYSADYIVDWINRTLPKIKQLDDPRLPSI